MYPKTYFNTFTIFILKKSNINYLINHNVFIYFRCIKILHILFNSLSDHQLQNCPFALILLSMLYEFVMATDLDNTTIISIIDLIIGSY